jgi:hypothetical protein
LRMSEPACRVALVCEQPLEFLYRDGLFYVSDPTSGGCQAFRPHTFLASFHNAGQAMQDYYARRTAEVIDFPKAAEAGH